PPTPTIDDTESSMAQHDMATSFKPLDLSGKNPSNSQQQPDISTSTLQLASDNSSLLPISNSNSTASELNPMALLLMNSFLINAQLKLKDVHETTASDSNQSNDRDSPRSVHSSERPAVEAVKSN